MIKTISISDLINKNSRKVEFHLARFEEMSEPENISFPHKHNFYEIFWLTKGNSTQIIDYQSYQISENTLFFISPGQLHLFEDWRGVEGFVILFTEDFFLRIFQDKNILFELSYLDNLYENPFLKLEKEQTEILQPIINLLFSEAKNKKQSTDSIQPLLLVLLRRIQNLFNSHSFKQRNRHEILIFKQFKDLVEANFTNNLSISEYAKSLNISSHQLNAFIKASSGETASEIIKKKHVLEAKQLLEFSELNINQIADFLGFSDSSYFARFFKKNVGLSPQEFRKNT